MLEAGAGVVVVLRTEVDDGPDALPPQPRPSLRAPRLPGAREPLLPHDAEVRNGVAPPPRARERSGSVGDPSVAGRVGISVSCGSPLSGDGPIAEVSFQTSGPYGATSPLEFNRAVLNSGSPTTCPDGGSFGVCGPELCDGIDNDCNGTVDDGIAPVATTCGAGACASTGSRTCQGGQLVDSCVAGTPTTEICDGIDNDCNGQVDENNPGGGGTCATGLPGVCSTGTTTCQGGSLICLQNTEASEEICDGLDNNCDGVVDEGCAVQ